MYLKVSFWLLNLLLYTFKTIKDFLNNHYNNIWCM